MADRLWELAPNVAVIQAEKHWLFLPPHDEQPLAVGGPAMDAVHLVLVGGMPDHEVVHLLSEAYGVDEATVTSSLDGVWFAMEQSGVLRPTSCAEDMDEERMSAMRVLTVCTGNVCRSVFAQRLLQSALSGDYRVSSAGTGARHQHGVPRQIEERLASRGLSAEGHAPRQLTAEMIDDADLILTATVEHRKAVLDLVPLALRRTFTMLEAAAASAVAVPKSEQAPELIRALARARSAVASGTVVDVADPFGRSASDYENMDNHVALAVDALAAYLARAS